MDTQPFLDWLLTFLESQGIGTFLILFGVWFLDRRLWPLVRDVIVATWSETRKAETVYLGRGVAALERIADNTAALVGPRGPTGSRGPGPCPEGVKGE